jgi:competence protein ComEA
MLQAWILRLRTLLQGKVILAVCLGFILAIGLSYYIIEQNLGKSKILNIEGNDAKPAAEEQSEGQSAADIVVDISGAVEKPGLYKLSALSRVGDVVNAAGGISKDASLEYVSKNLNLAQKLEDTQKIYVPFEWDLYENEEYDIQPLIIKTASNITTGSQYPASDNSKTTTSGSSKSTISPSGSSQKTNVNKASLEELDKLSGIGPVYAKKIIDNRTYKDYTELVTKAGVPKSTLEKIKDEISY